MDIDLVINRTVVYLTLTILLILAYLAVVTVVSFMTDGLWCGRGNPWWGQRPAWWWRRASCP